MDITQRTDFIPQEIPVKAYYVSSMTFDKQKKEVSIPTADGQTLIFSFDPEYAHVGQKLQARVLLGTIQIPIHRNNNSRTDDYLVRSIWGVVTQGTWLVKHPNLVYKVVPDFVFRQEYELDLVSDTSEDETSAKELIDAVDQLPETGGNEDETQDQQRASA